MKLSWALLIYFVWWWVVFLVLLSLKLVPPEHEREDPTAPLPSNVKPKMVISSLLALPVTLLTIVIILRIWFID